MAVVCGWVMINRDTVTDTDSWTLVWRAQQDSKPETSLLRLVRGYK